MSTDLRTAADLSFQEVADRAGVPVSVVTDVQDGVAELTTSDLVGICRALDVDSSALLAGADPRFLSHHKNAGPQ